MNVPDQNKSLTVDRAFVEDHAPWMLRLANKVLMDPQLAEDAVQDAFLAAHTKSGKFERRSDVRTWLYRITVNAALGIRRKRSSDSCQLDDWLPEFDANACRIEAPWQHLRTTEEVLEQAELIAFVQRSVESLPENYRINLQLRNFEELSVNAVAGILNISEENVKVRTHRARSALKRLLEPLLRGKSSSEITASSLPDALAPTTGRLVKGAVMAYLPMMITCRQFENFIMDYLEDSLSARQRRMFELHIRTCRECRDYLAAYHRSREIANATLTTLNDVPADLVKAVISALE
jgi:RNA polymerase sigma-70 factor (ECF subfamily)